MKGAIRSTLASSRLSTPSSAYLASSASSTARACGPYFVNTSRFLTFSARSRRVSGLLVEGDVADQVEGIEVLAQLLGDRVERQALGLQLLDDRLLALRRLPALEEVVEAGEALLQRLLGEVAQALGDQLAVLVEILHALGDDLGADAIDVDLARLCRRPAAKLMSGRPIDDGFVRAGLRWQRLPVISRWRASSGGAIGIALRPARKSAPARRRNRGRRNGWSRRGSRSA